MSAMAAETEPMMTAALKVTKPARPKAIRIIQYAATSTANRKRKSGISQDNQRPAVIPQGGCPIPRTIFDANGMPMPRVTTAPTAAYIRDQCVSGRARIKA